MTIHHDKLAYGKLEKSQTDLTDSEIEEIARYLSEEDEEEELPDREKDKQKKDKSEKK